MKTVPRRSFSESRLPSRRSWNRLLCLLLFYLGINQAQGQGDFVFELGVGGNFPWWDEFYDLAVDPEERFLIGGYFLIYPPGEIGHRTGLARWTRYGGLDASFKLDGRFDGSAILRVYPQHDKYIVRPGSPPDGFYSTLLRLRNDGSIDTTFRLADIRGGGITVVSIQADEKLLIGGDFTRVDGWPRRYLARLMPSGELDASFDPGLSAYAPVVALASLPGGQIFFQDQDLRQSGFCRIGPEGRVLARRFPTPFPLIGDAFALSEGRILGLFGGLDPVGRRIPGRLLRDLTLDPSFVVQDGRGESQFRLIHSLPSEEFVSASLFPVPERPGQQPMGTYRILASSRERGMLDAWEGTVAWPFWKIVPHSSNGVLMAYRPIAPVVGPDGSWSSSRYPPFRIRRATIPISEPVRETALIGPEGVSVVHGRPLFLSVTGAAPKGSTLQWFHGVRPIPGENRWQFVRPQVFASDAGDYTLVVSNVMDVVTSVTARVVVDSAVPVIEGDQTQVFRIGSNPAVIRGKVHGNEPISFLWEWETAWQLTEVPEFGVPQGVEWVKLVAKNAYGSTERTYRVVEQLPPVLLSDHIHTYEGKQVRIQSRPFDAEEPARFSWHHPELGVEVEGATNAYFQLDDVRASMAGL